MKYSLKLLKNKSKKSKQKFALKKTHKQKKNKHCKIKAQTGGDAKDKSLLEYYIFSSHNTEVITSQIRGICSICSINEFMSTPGNSFLNGGCLELDFNGVILGEDGKTPTDITIGHLCTIDTQTPAVYTFSTLLSVIIEKYKQISTSDNPAYPLIISVDANLIHKKLPGAMVIAAYAKNENTKFGANTPEFYELWNRILTKCFENNQELRFAEEITRETPVNKLMNKILFRWQYDNPTKSKGQNLFRPSEINYLSKLNIIKEFTQDSSGINTVSYPIGENILADNISEIVTSVTEGILVRTYPKPSIFNYNYNFAKCMLAGAQIVAINLQLLDKFALGYAAFFEYDRFISIPSSIRQLAEPVKQELQHRPSVINEDHPNQQTVVSQIVGAINSNINTNQSPDEEEYITNTNDNIIETIKNNIQNIINEKKGQTSIKIIDEIYNYMSKNIPITENEFKLEFNINNNGTNQKINVNFNPTSNGYGLSIDDGISGTALVGGGAPNTFDYVWDNTDSKIEIKEVYNLFNPVINGKKYQQIYRHYLQSVDINDDYSIFNVIYIRFSDGGSQYHGCFNLSKVDLSTTENYNFMVSAYKIEPKYKYDNGNCGKALIAKEIDIKLKKWYTASV